LKAVAGDQSPASLQIEDAMNFTLLTGVMNVNMCNMCHVNVSSISQYIVLPVLPVTDGGSSK